MDSTEYNKLVDFIVSALEDQEVDNQKISFSEHVIFVNNFIGKKLIICREVSLNDINPNDIEPGLENESLNKVCLITKFRRRKVIERSPDGEVNKTDHISLWIKQEIDYKQVRVAFARIIEHWNTQGCFIATAVYESSASQEVLTLRKFRDEILSNTFFGKQMIKAYYIVSPSIAKFIENKKSLKSFIKYVILDPIVKKVQHHLKKGSGSN